MTPGASLRELSTERNSEFRDKEESARGPEREGRSQPFALNVSRMAVPSATPNLPSVPSSPRTLSGPG